MPSRASAGIKYAGRKGADYGGPLEVSKFRVRKTAGGLSIRLEGSGYLTEASMSFTPELAKPLAQAILSVAEGYVSGTESEVA